MNFTNNEFKRIGRKTNAPSKAFTLIETLMAVAVLMIAIAGPLVVANNGLVAALYAKDQSIATSLAQEGMEMVRNVKDVAIYNDHTGQGFYELFYDSTRVNGPYPVSSNTLYDCQSSLEDSSHMPCGVDFVYDSANDNYHVTPYLCNSDFDSSGQFYCTLEMNPNADIAYGRWSPASISGKSTFKRSFKWKTIGINNNEVLVTVTVDWMESTVKSSVSISEEMVATVL